MNDKQAVRLAVRLLVYSSLVALGWAAFGRKACGPHHGVMKNACIANLKQIGRAKAVWAMENRVTDVVRVPAMNQFCGPTNYLRDLPTCPGRGHYAVRRLTDKPTCSVPGHTL